MAILLRILRNQYFEGQVSLYRGDKWALNCQIVDSVGGVDQLKDLRGASATGYFPSTGGDTVAASVQLTDAQSGQIQLQVPASDTPQVALSTGGIQPYVVVADLPASGGPSPFTAQAPAADVVILDREFTQS